MSERRKITREQFDAASNAAFAYADRGGEVLLTDPALVFFLAELGIEIEQERARFSPVEFIWVERTWVDVREGDVIRPAGQTHDENAARVIAIGPVNHWHAAPNARQYAPNESPLEWSARNVTLAPILVKDGAPVTYSPQHGMRPDAAVDIKVTRGELAAIEVLGGWSNRVEAAR